MKHYETMIIVPPTVSESELDSMVQSISEDLKNRHNATEANVQKWGKRNLAYPIQKFTEGYYILCDYRSENEKTVSEFESRLRLSETIIRFMTIRRDLEEKAEERLKQKLLKRGKREGAEESVDYEGFADEDSDLD
ncbi:MAG: 30S ribosomal protein S6 [Acidobacteria bacterium]|nr:30S ribosomal protein S6 [Acidobacteriota bacterium]